jgi:hypothetical protein
MSLFRMFVDFTDKALPLIASGIGYTIITAALLTSIVSACVKIAAFFMGVCTP